MATYNNVLITSSDWVDLNTLSGAPVGTAIEILNLSVGNIILREQTASPLSTEFNGAVLFSIDYGTLSKANISAGSLKIWARLANAKNPCTVAVYN